MGTGRQTGRTTGRQTGMTGMTGMRTGSGPAGTGRVPPARGSGYNKALQYWNNLTPKQKMTYGMVLGLIVVMFLFIHFYGQSQQLVPLYAQGTLLTPRDVQDIQLQLNRLGIQNTVIEGGSAIAVPPAEKSKAMMKLAEYGLPHRTLGAKTDKPLAPPTADEGRENRKQQLEYDITDSLREIEGVADARVKLVQPDNSSTFIDERKDATAAIMLRVVPGYTLSQAQVKGIINLVSFSVQELAPENIAIVDTNGISLVNFPVTTAESSAGGASGAGYIMDTQLKDKTALEKSLEGKVQSMLDEVLGPKRAVVRVNAEIGYGQSKTESTIYGNPGDVTGEKEASVMKETETYNSDSKNSNKDEGTQMGGTLTAVDKGKNYSKEKIATKKLVNETKTETVDTAPKAKRVTASVFVDNLKPEEIAKVKSIVKNAIGLDESRGDEIVVESTVFSKDQFSAIRDEMYKNPAPAAHPNVLPKSLTMYGMTALIVILLGILAVFVFKQKQAAAQQSQMFFGSYPTETSTDISDLLTDKIGQSSPAPVTRVNTTEDLERLAKEKPTKVAELLKSTWLSDKEG